ncbi:transmembrane protein 161A [Labeo rohita]|uniref:Transmembrane protein 161A n=2 Tax=Labeonini TaxID=2743697 RepID=A0A498MJL7_LABRO|nr:transmembrane protein 161A [Labeo rohita]
MGVQLVVSLLAVSIMQRMAPHLSFARWLLCNGSLFRFKHPSEGELCALAGKQIPKTSRRDRRQNGHGESKPLTVPKDIDLHLESAPVNVLDALVLRFFVEYQWLIDFAVYTTGIYLFTEGYYSVVDAILRRTLYLLTSHYFRSEEGGERSVCLAFGFLSLLIAMLVLVVREDYLEFGLEPGFTSLFDNFEVFAKQQGYEWSVPFTKLSVKLGLAVICAFIGALLAFPGLRLAQTHLDAVQMNSDRPIIQILLHLSFLSPLVIIVMWIKPIARDFLGNAPMGKTSVTLLSSSAFNSVRLWTIVVLCVLRLLLTRYHLQAYLNLAQKWVEQMKKEAGRIAAIDIQRKASDFSWGLGAETPGVTPAPIIPTAPPPAPRLEDDEDMEDMEEDIQATVAHLTELFAALRGVLTPIFFRGIFAFLTWRPSLRHDCCYRDWTEDHSDVPRRLAPSAPGDLPRRDLCSPLFNRGMTALPAMFNLKARQCSE